jgi:hypothetical protein
MMTIEENLTMEIVDTKRPCPDVESALEAVTNSKNAACSEKPNE